MTICLLNSFYFTKEVIPLDKSIAIEIHLHLFLEKERR